MNVKLRREITKYNKFIQKLYLLWSLYKYKVPVYLHTIGFIITIIIGINATYHLIEMLMGSFKGTKEFLSGTMETVPIWVLLVSGAFIIINWLFSTRVYAMRSKKIRYLNFFIMFIPLVSLLLWFGISRTYLFIIPIYEIIMANGKVWALKNPLGEELIEVAIHQRDKLYFMTMISPIAFIGFISMFFLRKYRIYDLELKKAFQEFEITGKYVQKYALIQEVEYYPHVPLGRDAKTGEMVYLYGIDRTLNTVIVGAIGTGKSAALGIPMLYTDFDHMVKFIDDYQYNSVLEDYASEDIRGRYLNGITVIEPSNDLCMSVYQIAKAHGIPDEAITYIDPTNPNTPSFNALRGPTDKVAEVLAEVISGLNNGSADFFALAQRNHFKKYIYLLKEHDPTVEVTFDMLVHMYSDAQYTHKLHVKFKERLKKLKARTVDPTRDQANYISILESIDLFFDNNLILLRDKNGVPIMDESRGLIYVDNLESDVKGLRNELGNLQDNINIRRVLFGESEFDFDRHLEVGGLLLVNTAKGELGGLSRVLGKVILMNIQNAAFRREPKTSTYHHVLVDEAPEYLYPQFKSFPSQSRKYKIILTIIMQTLAQLEDEFGETFREVLMASMRQKLFYGDATGADAQAFSEISGEKQVYIEGEGETEASAVQDDPSLRSTANYSRQLKAVMSVNEVIYQEAFACAVKLVEKNKPMPVRVLQANFVPKDKMKQANIVTTKEAMDYWLSRRNFFKAKSIEEEIFNVTFSEDGLEQELKELKKEPIAVKEEVITQVPLLSSSEQVVVEQEQHRPPHKEELVGEEPVAVPTNVKEVPVAEAIPTMENEPLPMTTLNLQDLIPGYVPPAVEPMEVVEVSHATEIGKDEIDQVSKGDVNDVKEQIIPPSTTNTSTTNDDVFASFIQAYPTEEKGGPAAGEYEVSQLDPSSNEELDKIFR